MQFRDERFWKTFALSPFLAIAEDIIFVKKKKKKERERERMNDKTDERNKIYLRWNYYIAFRYLPFCIASSYYYVLLVDRIYIILLYSSYLK